MSRIFMLILAAAAACGAWGTKASAQAPAAPSFNCAAAKGPVETAICGNRKLAEADALMARLYPLVQVSAFGQGPSNQPAAQREWLKERGQCGGNVECLQMNYDERNQQLAVALLFSNRDLAMRTLRSLNPKAAPLYEAITMYVGGAPRDRLEPLLAPYFADGSGATMLDPDGIKTPRDALKSDHNFAEFMQITSAYLRDGPVPPPFPCGAILRKPDLIDATNPAFGSSMDNSIFTADCEATLPPLPKLTALRDRINSTWPPCEGTIQYTFYRSFHVSATAARAATKSQIAGFATSKDGRSPKPLPRRTGVSPAMANAAIAELTAYYQKYQGASSADANAYAKSAVYGMFVAAHQCD
jgi:uncharacterized protein YecT (DUF1311 family)